MVKGEKDLFKDRRQRGLCAPNYHLRVCKKQGADLHPCSILQAPSPLSGAKETELAAGATTRISWAQQECGYQLSRRKFVEVA